MSEAERTELEAQWRREFDRSWDEHFFYCAGPDKIFSGDDARWQHWLFVDLPPPLLDKFMAERERRGRVDRAPPTGRAAQGEGKQAGSPLENERAG